MSFIELFGKKTFMQHYEVFKSIMKTSDGLVYGKSQVWAGSSIPEFSKVGFGYVGYWKSRVWAGNEISGIGYFRVKTKTLLDFTNWRWVGYGKSRVWKKSGLGGYVYTRIFGYNRTHH